MIFVTYGVQLPFDRLIKAILEIAREDQQEIFAIQGNYASSLSLPDNVEFIGKLTETQFEQHLMRADIVVSHAGMGTLITSLKHSKKVVLVPRDASKNEHRNNHQMDTLDTFKFLSGVYPCIDTSALHEVIKKAKSDIYQKSAMSNDGPQKLSQFFQQTLNGATPPKKVD